MTAPACTHPTATRGGGMGRKPEPEVPIACTLAVGDMGDRLGDWVGVLAARSAG